MQARHLTRFADARLAVIEDAGHDVVRDTPDATRTSIRAYLAAWAVNGGQSAVARSPLNEDHPRVPGLIPFRPAKTTLRADPMTPARPDPDSLRKALHALLPGPDAPGLAVAMISGGALGSAAVGRAAPDGRAMTADTPLRIASLTKTFTAAAILRLWETGRLDLDAPLSALISARHDAMLLAGGYDTGAITPRHLLMHVSGLNDHFGSAAFTQAVLADPARAWTRTDQVAAMLETTRPLGHPGERFHYSDTGYLLLGEIVERTTGQALGPALRHLTGWTALGLEAIRWEGEPAATAPARAHQWMDGIDTHGFHGSVDAFGGGGMIASVADTTRLCAALFSGKVFDNRATLDEMLTAPGHPPDSPYRMGLFEEHLDGTTVFRHSGFWGVEALCVPGHGLFAVAATLDQAQAPAVRGMVEDLLRDWMTDP